MQFESLHRISPISLMKSCKLSSFYRTPVPYNRKIDIQSVQVLNFKVSHLSDDQSLVVLQLFLSIFSDILDLMTDNRAYSTENPNNW